MDKLNAFNSNLASSPTTTERKLDEECRVWLRELKCEVSVSWISLSCHNEIGWKCIQEYITDFLIPGICWQIWRTWLCQQALHSWHEFRGKEIFLLKADSSLIPSSTQLFSDQYFIHPCSYIYFFTKPPSKPLIGDPFAQKNWTIFGNPSGC